MSRSVLVLLAAAALGLAAWALLGRAPRAGLLAWNPSEGELRAMSPGWHMLPRWRWERLAERTLDVRYRTGTAGPGEVEVRLRWRPPEGSYHLPAAARPEDALAALLEQEEPALLSAVPLGCVTESDAAGADCPEGWRWAARERLAALLDSPAERLHAEFVATRDGLLRVVQAGLPATGRKVFLLGLDGLDWDFVLPLVEQGRMPHLARLMSAGAWGKMRTIEPILSPLIWTSIATARSPDEHGILDFVERDATSGRIVPVTGRQRRVPALWNIASALGRTTDVVGWWATWPAEPIRGTMVSDRLYYTLTQSVSREALREDPPAMVAPAERAEEFAALRDEVVRSIDADVLRRFMRISPAEFERAVAASAAMEDPIDGFRRILAATRTYLDAGLRLAERRPDLLMVYLEGTDTVGHLLAPYMPPPIDDSIPAERAAVYAEAVPRYFEAVDDWIGRYLEALPITEHSWIVVSDHGFRWGADRPRDVGEFDALTAAAWHQRDAVFLLAGPGVEPLGRVSDVPSIYDVAPTVTALLGLPRGTGWEGGTLPGVDEPALDPLDYERLVPPSSYSGEAAGAAPVDEEFLEQLRALGYLGGAESGAPEARDTSPSAGRTAVPADATQGELNNLGVILMNQERLDEAAAHFRAAIDRYPSYPTPYFNLRLILLKRESYEEADRLLWRGVGVESAETGVLRVEQAAKQYEALDDLERAVAVLQEGVRRFPDAERLWAQLLYDRGRLQQCEAGLEEGRRAAQRVPRSTEVLTLYGLAAACAGETAEARQVLERSLRLDPDQPTARNALSSLP